MELVKRFYPLAIMLTTMVVVGITIAKVASGGSADDFVGANLTWTFVLIGIISVIVLGFSVKEILQSKKALFRIGAGVVALLALYFGSFSAADNNVEALNIAVPATPWEVQFVGAITTMTIVLVAIGTLVLLGLELKKVISNG